MMIAMRDKGRSWAPPPLNPYKSLIINVALTGAVPGKPDNDTLPITPEEIARDAIACAEVGASIVHIHVRDSRGEPTHDRSLYEESISRIRQEVPELIICTTTSGRVNPNPNERATSLKLDPSLRPDMASLTLGSFNFPKTVSHNPPDVIESLLQEMKKQRVKPELEVFELGMVNTGRVLQARGLIEHSPYFNIILGSFGASPAFVGDLASIVARLPEDAEWASGGIGMFQRAMVMGGIVMGGNVRTGLEDCPRDPLEEKWSNVRAVEFAVAVAQMVGREVATPEEARRRLRIPSNR